MSQLNPVQAALDARFAGRRASIEAAEAAQAIVASEKSPAESAAPSKKEA